MINTLKKTLDSFVNSPLLILYSVLSDIAFLIVYTSAGNIFSELIGNRVANYSPTLTKNLSLYGISSLFTLEMFFILIFILAGLLFSYAIYCVFQGLSWWLAFKIVKQKTKFSEYLKNFFKINAVWLVAYALYSINDYFLVFRQKLAPEEFIITKYPLLILFVFVVLLAITSYVFQNISKAISFISKNFFLFLKSFSFVLLLLFLVDRFLVLLRFNQEIQLFAGLLSVFLTFAFSRVFLIKSFKM